ncbi:MAG: 30S ribosomal protein S17 [Parcubacteria group bacterium]|jgi:small subunit ribosomal protein S17
MDKKLKTTRGRVTGDKMDKTIIVSVGSFKTHPKYMKKYKSTKKYKVHDPENKHKIGDVVEFSECKPISKDKRFKIV